jgi:exopolysaccharide production protein ExoZ
MTSKLRTLQVVRGLAANLVVLSHLYVVEGKYTAGGVLPEFSLYGMAGVDLFFVLSGFIMVAVAGRGIGPIRFLWRRFARIYPTYWLISLVVLAISIAAPAMVNSSFEGPVSLWRSFLLLPGQTLPLLAVGWTLIHEMYFYLVFAVFLALRIPVLVGLAGWGVVLFAMILGIPDQIAESPVLQVVTSPLTLEFMMGAAAGLLWLNNRTPGALMAGTCGLTALVLAILSIAPTLSLVASPHVTIWRVAIFGIPAALVVYGLAGAEHAHKPRPLSLLVALGDCSYATYLVHVLVISAIGRVLLQFGQVGASASLVLIAAGFVATNIAGYLVYAVFERPTLHWLHQVSLALGSLAPAATGPIGAPARPPEQDREPSGRAARL